MVPTRSWAEVAQLYRRLEQTAPTFAPLRRLCEHAEHAPYRDLIFCATSMHTLLVSQHSELEWNSNTLRVEVDHHDHISFAFHEQPFVKPVAFQCSAEKILETFDRFLRKNKWVSDSALDQVR